MMKKMQNKNIKITIVTEEASRRGIGLRNNSHGLYVMSSIPVGGFLAPIGSLDVMYAWYTDLDSHEVPGDWRSSNG
jgi:hypothetical protein